MAVGSEAGIGDAGEVWSNGVVGRASLRLALVLVLGVVINEEITAADVGGPIIFRWFAAHGRDEKRADVVNHATALRAVWFVADAFAPTADGNFVPELIAAPADQAELGV